MKKFFLLAFAFVIFASPAFAADYDIDPAHSSVSFKIRHLAISKVLGKFTEFSGAYSFDPKNVSASTAKATIAVTSINTDNQKRDDHLRSPDFFDAKKFASMTFTSTKIVPGTDGEFDATGDLEIHGVIKPVTLHVTFEGTATDPWGNERSAFTATTKLNRKDFGLTWNKALETGGLLVGEDVEIEIQIEGIKKK